MRAHLLLSACLCFAFIFSGGACKSETSADPAASAQPPIKAQSPKPSASSNAPGAGLAPKLTRAVDQAQEERLDLYRSYVNAIVTLAPHQKSGYELLNAMMPKQVEPNRVSTGAPQIGDFCDKNNIRRVVGAKAKAITFCFERELQFDPKLGGKVIAQWKIGLDGAVMGTPHIVRSTMGNKSVEGCISRIITRMRFEAPNGGICTVEHPFNFIPESVDKRDEINKR